MTDEHPGDVTPAAGVSRRRLLSTAGGVAAVGGLVAITAGGVLVSRQRPTAPAVVADDATVRRLTDLSRTLCGGGTFAADQAAMLLRRLAADPALSRGFVDLLLDPPVAGAGQTRSPQAEAAMREILLFWYAGELAGAPVPNRAAVYDQLTAWQAMYTAPFAVCKVYGGWAEAPSDQPAKPVL